MQDPARNFGTKTVQVVQKMSDFTPEQLATIAAKEVHTCLNYGGISCNNGQFVFDHEQGDLSDEVAHMRRFAHALNGLASALESQTRKLSEKRHVED